MNKSLLLALSASTLLFSATAFRGSGTEMVEVELRNPCSRNVSFGYSLSAGGSTSTNYLMSVNESKKMTIPKGAYVKFSRKNEAFSTTIGKVDYKGQVFSCDCK